ncbi:MAG: SET domain-containing protein [Chitinophagaceae bacterium]
MKRKNYLHPLIFVGDAKEKGRGMFASGKIATDTVIEIAPVIVMNHNERKLLDQTLLHDYIFEWGQNQCCVAMGYISIYNHSYNANCRYEMNFVAQFITVTSLRGIKPGEELSINYTADSNDKTPVWFEVL